jgi:hypothetical protein
MENSVAAKTLIQSPVAAQAQPIFSLPPPVSDFFHIRRCRRAV